MSIREKIALVVALLVLSLCTVRESSAQVTPESKAFESQVQEAGGEAAPAAGALGSKAMRRANEFASELVQGRMRTTRKEDYARLQDIAKAEVVVVTGAYDRVEQVLDAVGIRYVLIPATYLDRIDLMASQILMINCPGQVSEEAVRRIKRFVRAGGYLFTTDWALIHSFFLVHV